MMSQSNDGSGKVARYEKIALDIAYSILNEEWKVGDMIKGRSTLSGKYSVSPETIRRAIKLLEELMVVEVIHCLQGLWGERRSSGQGRSMRAMRRGRGTQVP